MYLHVILSQLPISKPMWVEHWVCKYQLLEQSTYKYIGILNLHVHAMMYT